MIIKSIFNLSRIAQCWAKALWEYNMCERWEDYNESDMFVVEDSGDVVGGFSIYRDESDGIRGIFCSGWAERHRGVPTTDIIKQIAFNVGDVYFKTDQRTAKILLEKIGERVKTTDRFVYYIIRGNKNGKTKTGAGRSN